jgi:hypothetical protein
MTTSEADKEAKIEHYARNPGAPGAWTFIGTLNHDDMVRLYERGVEIDAEREEQWRQNPPVPLKTQCDTCRFAQQTTFGGMYCRRRAPVSVLQENGAHKPAWPVVSEYDWCGEFEWRRS